MSFCIKYVHTRKILRGRESVNDCLGLGQGEQGVCVGRGVKPVFCDWLLFSSLVFSRLTTLQHALMLGAKSDISNMTDQEFLLPLTNSSILQ